MKTNDLQEEWRPVAGYEGLYEISSLGRVKSVKKKTNESEKRQIWVLNYRIKKQKA